jgi:putative ABC transport system permease protein
MSPLRIISVASRALVRNKLRSFLTLLGVIIGVGAVIAMTAIGEGAKARVAKTFEKMGTNMLVVRSGTSKRGGVRGGSGSKQSLTWSDLEAIQTEVDSVRYAAPELTSRAQLASEDQNWSSSVVGITPEYFAIRNWEIASGDLLTHADADGGAKVVVLGNTVATNLFGEHADPVGQTVRIKNIPFTVVGVTKKKGQSAFGSDYDDVAFISSKAFRTKISGGLGKYLAGRIYVSAVSEKHTAEAQSAIEQLLRRRHNSRTGDDFSVRNLADIASAQQEGASTMTSLLAGIALVSLLVGGIGIMNIMLVSVTERTREIGLRMAIGAKPRDILAQFLVESITLALVGGMLGVLAGLGVAKYLVAKFQWPMLIQTDVIFLAVGFSGLVGIVFGLYPAHKASRLDPIEALRYE